jgi:hypothetical protein
MRDDSPEALAADPAYVPLGLECRQLAWAYGAPGLVDFNVVEYTFFNRSGHPLDSLFVGFKVDMDAGPVSSAAYFNDDLDLPGFPSGEFTVRVGTQPGDLQDPARRQFPHSPALNAFVHQDSALCARFPLRLNGFSLADADGDGGTTPGIASFLLVHHTVNGLDAPSRVGFRAFRSFAAGTPYAMGGNPSNDDERYQFLSGVENVDPDGFIAMAGGSSPADYSQWCSVGPFRDVADGESFQVTIAFAVQNGSYAVATQYANDYENYRAGSITPAAMLAKYPVLALAKSIQVAYEGRHELRNGIPVPDFHGRETGVRLPTGSTPMFVVEDCQEVGREPRFVVVTDQQTNWFDFDCDWCTGVWDATLQTGLFHNTWVAPSPPLAVEGRPTFDLTLSVSPNPVRDGAGLDLTLGVAAEIRAGVYDPSGRRIRDIGSRRMAAGHHRIVWDLLDDAGRHVAPGLYFWRVSDGGHERTARLAVVR